MYEWICQVLFVNKQVCDFMCLFFFGVSVEMFDSQNCIIIFVYLCQYVGLQKEFIVIGVGVYVEIWDVESWNVYFVVGEEIYFEFEQEVILGFF